MASMITIVFLCIISASHSFYNIQSALPYYWLSRIVVPTTNEELAKALCGSYDRFGICNDIDIKIILLTKVFDFTGSEGKVTEDGCYHLYSPVCISRGQKKLNLFDQCKGLVKVNVTYDKAGKKPLEIGSNKYILSRSGGLKGKGIRVYKNKNVFIYGLSITDINDELIWGGDAITLDGASNAWIHENYISRIGRQMLVTGYNACHNITISYNVFDGRTPHSAYCDGFHYWLWLFEGSDDTITLYHNLIHHTSGRGAHLTGLPNSKVLLHMIKNYFVNVKHAGLIEAPEQTARILIEGNYFSSVTSIVSNAGGKIYYPFNQNDASACKQYLGRDCLMNKVINSGGLNFKNNEEVLKELSHYSLVNTKVIDEFAAQFRKYKPASNKDENQKEKRKNKKRWKSNNM